MKTIINEYYEAADDNIGSQNPQKFRKVKLTLHHLNKLRKMRSLKKFEDEMRKKRLSSIYGSESGEPESPMF